MQYYEVNNFRIRSSNSQQLEEEKEQVHRSSVDLRKKGEGVKKSSATVTASFVMLMVSK